MSDLDVRGISAAGAMRGTDRSITTVGRVLAVNASSATVLVSVHGSEGAWIPAVAGRYLPGGACRVLLDPEHGGRTVTVLGPVDVRPSVALAKLVGQPNDTTNRATLTWDGSPVTVPFIPAVYPADSQVWVSLDDWCRPLLVVGPSEDPLPPAAPAIMQPVASSVTAQATTTLLAQWSGTYRYDRGAFDEWNVGRYGGRSTLYQGDDGYGSGLLAGLATYGDQVVNLGAVRIDKLEVMLRGVGAADGPATVQGSPQGTRPETAPASSGSTATGEGWVELDAATREGFRTGTVKGLVLVGQPYRAVAGTGNGDGMALRATYMRQV